MFSLKSRVKLKYTFIFILGVLIVGPLGGAFASWNIEAAYFGNWSSDSRISYLIFCIIYGIALYHEGYKKELKKRIQDRL